MPSLNIPMLHPKLETEKLILREIELIDREAIYQIYSDDLVTDESEIPPLRSIYEADHLIVQWAEDFQQKKGIRWGIARREDGDLVGTCGYTGWYPAMRGQIGYDLGRACWGQGLMSEAMQAVLCYGFEEVGLNRIEGLVNPGNERSIHLLNRLGFHREGLLREYGYWKGKFWDQIMYAMLRQDWKGIS